MTSCPSRFLRGDLIGTAGRAPPPGRGVSNLCLENCCHYCSALVLVSSCKTFVAVTPGQLHDSVLVMALSRW